MFYMAPARFARNITRFVKNAKRLTRIALLFTRKAKRFSRNISHTEVARAYCLCNRTLRYLYKLPDRSPFDEIIRMHLHVCTVRTCMCERVVCVCERVCCLKL